MTREEQVIENAEAIREHSEKDTQFNNNEELITYLDEYFILFQKHAELMDDIYYSIYYNGKAEGVMEAIKALQKLSL